jgi:hypothetical protein
LEAMSISVRMSCSSLFQSWSSVLKAHVLFIVMQDSQSTPGRNRSRGLLLGRAEVARPVGRTCSCPPCRALLADAVC